MDCGTWRSTTAGRKGGESPKLGLRLSLELGLDRTLTTGLCEYTVIPSRKWLKTKIFSPWPGSKLGSMRSPFFFFLLVWASRTLVLEVALPNDSLPN